MADEPPYLRIAGRIRRRIESGDLAPGDRVPSTRDITAQWGVAMATATKVLTTLRQEGLVHAVRGVGTVVTEPRRERHVPAGRGLTRERIVRTSIALADTEGFAALSMRRVAAEFGVSTMALYRHVPNRGELIRLMSETVFSDGPPGPEPAGWRERLAAECRWLWTRYERHPWLAGVMATFTRPMASPHAMRYTERVLNALSGLGLTAPQMLHVHLSLFGFVQGVAMAAESESRAWQDTGMTADEWLAANEARAAAVQSTGDYPTLGALFELDEYTLDLTSLFEFGLDRMLDGVAALVERSGGGASRRT
ncbi:TetR/AcrR family transcriptional regulator C-terminal domain-containing protein [Streptomyces sp. RFCAC02]|uniref:TetR/AcrR family transcriptional regulator C-terminal domain-containing protein n=1 Tax=Streptomyces sp. RFCAC02 TaxID=2499143 RepID=UPI0010220A2C|nr:TetR/AcrR family transcriptional regulator C-terminal domain-containing protein [Streptomyces sp. RFCAC02]